jgi:hypothetical protein
LNAFPFLWSASLVFHAIGRYIINGDSVGDFTELFARSALPLLVLFRPRSPRLFLAAVLAHVLVAFWYMPLRSENTGNFILLVNLAILAGAGKTFAPVARVQVLLVYWLAAFHKLNEDFLDPSVSAASWLYLNLARIWAHFLPVSRAVLTGNIYLTLVIETLVPALLLFRATRRWGILCLLFFHLVLGSIGVYDFSAVMFSLLLLYMPELVEPREPRFLKAGLAAFAGALLLVTVPFSPLRLDPSRLGGPMLLVWSGYGLFLFFTFARALLPAPSVFFRRAGELLSIPRPAQYGLVALTIFVGITRYLGLNTLGDFSMYSSVRTENGSSNHLLVPASFQIAGYQRDMIRILSSSDVELQDYADRCMQMPFHTFRALVAQLAEKGHADTRVTYSRAGTTHALTRLTDEPGLLTPPSFLERKLLNFKPRVVQLPKLGPFQTPGAHSSCPS